MTTKILTFSFYALFLVTPLLWMPFNYELFEYNKMMFVYLLTIIITACWLLNMIQTKTFILKRTPLDIPLVIFLLANILSTIFSIDHHTSMWGYYSRSNGGLLSIISYTILYYALISNFDKEKVLKFLKIALAGGVIVSLWAIPEHFGVSPSCIILTGHANAACWVQNVQDRVFATLGQPNWLAAYLVMLIFPVLAFLLSAKGKLPLILNSAFLILLYMAFTFTKSRGGTLGLIAGLAVFLALFTLPHLRKLKGKSRINFSFLKPLAIPLAIIFLITFYYGSSLFSRFNGVSSVVVNQVTNDQPAKASQPALEVEGGETPKIRFIVWQGALDIFKHYPVFGSGVETFAYSYYGFRPIAHNLTTEWDFLYNKAHNEFLNYLATTGIVGFVSYMAIILTFIIWSIKLIIKSKNNLLVVALLASYISYHVQNIFSFSVVIIALFFFLFPGIAFVLTDSNKTISTSKFTLFGNLLNATLYRRPFYTKISRYLLIIAAASLTLRLFNYYQADTMFTQGVRANEAGNPGKAYNQLSDAVSLNGEEPLYRSELGYAAASAAVALVDQDASASAKLKDQAIFETKRVLNDSPRNVSFLRTAIRTYFVLSSLDKNYSQKTLETVDQALKLAPTDAKLMYNKGVILSQEKKDDEAIAALQQTIKLKPNYKDAYLTLGDVYFEQGQKNKAIEQANLALKFLPGDPEILDKIITWEKK